MFANLRSRLGGKAHRTARRTSRRFASTRARLLRVESLEDRRLLALAPELVRDVSLGDADAAIANLTPHGASLFFVADDGHHSAELWKSDGSAGGTQIVRDIRIGQASPFVNSNRTYTELAMVNGLLLFRADDEAHGHEMWVSDGTEAGTTMLLDINTNNHGFPAFFTEAIDRLFFLARDDAHGTELWVSNASVEGTHLVKDICSDCPGAAISGFEYSDGQLYFGFDDDLHGIELWRSDGTDAGTKLINDIHPGGRPDYYGGYHGYGSDPVMLGGSNNGLLFAANDGVHGRELWTTDGTTDGTRLVSDIRVGNSGSLDFGESARLGGDIVFSADDGVNGLQLWISDGTPDGTNPIREIGSGDSNHKAMSLTTLGATVYFTVNDGRLGYELWRTDGTDAGTHIVKDIFPGAYGSAPRELLNVNGTLFFAADDGEHGIELWRSDGTEAGTFHMEEITPGSVGGEPQQLTSVNGTLYFSAHHTELWKLAPLPGDTNYDGVVDLVDLNNVRNYFGYEGDQRPGDTTGDGVVGLDDLNAVRNHFGGEAPALTGTVDARHTALVSQPSTPDVRREAQITQVSAKVPTAMAVDLLFARESDATTPLFKSRALRRISTVMPPR